MAGISDFLLVKITAVWFLTRTYTYPTRFKRVGLIQLRPMRHNSLCQITTRFETRLPSKLRSSSFLLTPPPDFVVRNARSADPSYYPLKLYIVERSTVWIYILRHSNHTSSFLSPLIFRSTLQRSIGIGYHCFLNVNLIRRKHSTSVVNNF